jgi:hypothetical protein
MNENSNPKLKIYQAFHKPFHNNPGCNWIQPVGVNGYCAPGVQADSDGQNISALNPYYNELTAYYWVWKNSTADTVGFYHYRRYLNYVIDETWKYGTTVGLPADENIVGYLTHAAQYDRLNRILNVCDVVVPKKAASDRSIEEHYLYHHEHGPWKAFVAALESRYPQYHDHIDVLRLSCITSICNIFVMKRPLFNQYCTELFAIIDPIFAEFGPRYDSYNNRYPGFLAERFLGFWLHIRQLRSFEAPLIQLL